MKRVVLVCVLTAVLALTGIPAMGQTPPYLNAKLAVALVETNDGTGSGFAVAPNLIATACHVVKGAAGIRGPFLAAKVQIPAPAPMGNEQYEIAFLPVPLP